MCATNIGLCIYLLILVDFGLLYYYLFFHFISFFLSPALHSLFRLTPVYLSIFSVEFRLTPDSVILEYILRCIPFNSGIFCYTGYSLVESSPRYV